MGTKTTRLDLLKPGENDYYNQQTEQADNWQKVDDYAVYTDRDKNGIWGGEYGGKIQDPIPKELNKRYIDNINGKAFICIKAGDSSVVSNTIEYFTPCNVADNLAKLQNLSNKNPKRILRGAQITIGSRLNFQETIKKPYVIYIGVGINPSDTAYSMSKVVIGEENEACVLSNYCSADLNFLFLINFDWDSSSIVPTSKFGPGSDFIRYLTVDVYEF